MDLYAASLHEAKEAGLQSGPGIVGRKYVRGRALGRGLRDRADALEVVIPQELFLVRRDVVHCDEDGALLQIHVVADGPHHLAERRVRSMPFTLNVGAQNASRRVAGSLGFVEPPNGVVRLRDREHIVGRPSVVEVMRVHAWHAHRRHVLDLFVRQVVPLIDGNRV